jgi:hypothetical protein
MYQTLQHINHCKNTPNLWFIYQNFRFVGVKTNQWKNKFASGSEYTHHLSKINRGTKGSKINGPLRDE